MASLVAEQLSPEFIVTYSKDGGDTGNQNRMVGTTFLLFVASNPSQSQTLTGWQRKCDVSSRVIRITTVKTMEWAAPVLYCQSKGSSVRRLGTGMLFLIPE